MIHSTLSESIIEILNTKDTLYKIAEVVCRTNNKKINKNEQKNEANESNKASASTNAIIEHNHWGRAEAIKDLSERIVISVNKGDILIAIARYLYKNREKSNIQDVFFEIAECIIKKAGIEFSKVTESDLKKECKESEDKKFEKAGSIITDSKNKTTRDQAIKAIAQFVIDSAANEDKSSNLFSISKHFDSAFDKNDRTAALKTIALLIASKKLTPQEEIVGLWLIYYEYMEETSHPFKRLFELVVTMHEKDQNFKQVVEFANACLNKKVQQIVTENQNLNTAANILQSKSFYTEKYAGIVKIKPEIVIEEILKNAITDHQAVFIETFFVKLLCDHFSKSPEAGKENKGGSIPLSQMLDLVIMDDKNDPFSLDIGSDKDSVNLIFFITSFLKGDLKEAFSLMLLFLKFDKDTIKLVTNNEVFSPIIFYYFLRSKDFSSTKLVNVLKNFDVFSSIQNSIKKVKENLSKDIFSIIAVYIQNLMYITYKYSSTRDQNFLFSNIVPILIKTAIEERSTPFQDKDEFIKTFAWQKKGKEFFTKAFPYYAAVCKNRECVAIITSMLTIESGSGGSSSSHSPSNYSSSPNAKNKKVHDMKNCFIDFLFDAERIIISGSTAEDEENKAQKAQRSAFVLLQRICQYSYNHHLIEAIANRFMQSQSNDTYKMFYKFISEFLWSPIFAESAAIIIRYTVENDIYASFMFLDAQLSSRFTDIIKIIENTSNSDQIISSFISISRTMISKCFKEDSKIEQIPKFVKFILQDNFPRIIHRKFQSIYSKWTVLTLLIESCSDYAYISPEFVNSIHSSETFISALATAITIGATALNHDESATSQTLLGSDRTDIKYAVEFESATLSFLQLILTKYLNSHADTSPLCRIFFDENSEACSIFSSLINFLQIQLPAAREKQYNDTVPIPISGHALKVIELLCQIAYRMGNVSVDAFYSSAKQEILEKSFYRNSFYSSSSKQSYGILDFISSTLMTQPAFAFSLLPVAKQYILASVNQINILKLNSRLFLSYSRLLANMWLQLSSDSKLLNEIFTNKLWEALLPILTEDCQFYEDAKNRANFILSQNYLLQAFILKALNVESNQITQKMTLFIYKLKEISFGKIFQNLFDNLDPANLPKVTVEKLLSDGNTVKLFKDESEASKFLSVTREYGKNFYIDTPLVKWYKYDNLAQYLENYNLMLSQIDACTHLAQTLSSCLATYIQLLQSTISKQSANGGTISHISKLFPKLDYVIGNVSNIIKPQQLVQNGPLMLFPESTVLALLEIVSHLFQLQDPGDNLLTKDLLNNVIEYLKIRKTPQLFSFIEKIISCSTLGDDDENVDPAFIQSLENLFSICLEQAIQNKEISAINCVNEIAAKLECDDNLLVLTSRQSLLFEAVDKLAMNENLGPVLYQIVSILCMNQNTCRIIISSGIAKQLCNKRPPKESKIWFGILTLLSSIQTDNKLTHHFIIDSLPTVAFMLNENSFSSELQSSLTLFILKISNLYSQISIEYPDIFNSLMKLLFKRMKKTFAICTDMKTSDNNFNYLVTLRNCLLIFNTQLDFPFTELPGISDNSDNRNTTIERTKAIIDHFEKRIADNSDSNDTGKMFTEKMQIFVTILESAARLFTGLVIMENNKSNQTLEENISQFKDTIEKIKRALQRIFNNDLSSTNTNKSAKQKTKEYSCDDIKERVYENDDAYKNCDDEFKYIFDEISSSIKFLDKLLIKCNNYSN